MTNALMAYSMRWKIENISHVWWLKKGERIDSPAFVIDAPECTKWSLRLYPVGNKDGGYVAYYLNREKDCSGPDIFEVSYELALLGIDGSILKEKSITKHKFIKDIDWGFNGFETHETVFVTEREEFLPEDTLTVQCTLWTTDEKPNETINLFVNTTIKIKRRPFLWKIDKPLSLKSAVRNKFKDNLVDFDLVLNEGLDRLNVNMISFDETIKYISCNTSIIDSERGKTNFGCKKYFSSDLKKEVLSFNLLFPEILMENNSQYFPNDVLSLNFEFVYATINHFDCRLKYSKLEGEIAGKDKSQSTAPLNSDIKSLYYDGILSDMELRTSTKTFQVHKLILSARSLVFRNMFSHDMKEKNCGYVDIADFEEDTVHRMLQYIYTDSMENLQFESASKLYAAADKYQILSLRCICCSFLKQNLCPSNACDALVLADQHNDDELKTYVQDYILEQHKEVFYSEKWKDFMNSHPKPAADLMYRKISNRKINLTKKRKSE